MTVRALAAVFFLGYGALIPFLAGDFVDANPVTTAAMIGCCVVMAALLLSRRASLINVVIAAYVLRVYLTRPYVNVFLDRLNEQQLHDVFTRRDQFYSPPDAVIVYLSLLSLLIAWFVGLHIVRPKPDTARPAPRLFAQVDEIVTTGGWRFWLVWGTLTYLNYRSPADSWQGIATGEGVPLFALGLFSTAAIDMICLYAFLSGRRVGSGRWSWPLLVPAITAAVRGTLGGGRGAVFVLVSFGLFYWLFVNLSKRLSRRHILTLALLVSMAPVVIFGGLVAAQLRPLLSGATDEDLYETVSANLNLADPSNPIVNTIYFGATELLHRLSSLDAQLLILNDHWAHDPGETYNIPDILRRTANSLVPSALKPFPGMLTINQLFDYVYFNSRVVYSSAMWSIQGSLYLLFGVWWSPLVVLVAAAVVGRHYKRLDGLARASPAFAAFAIMFLLDFIENGTLERVIADEVVRASTSLLAVILLVLGLRRLRISTGPIAHVSHEKPS